MGVCVCVSDLESGGYLWPPTLSLVVLHRNEFDHRGREGKSCRIGIVQTTRNCEIVMIVLFKGGIDVKDKLRSTEQNVAEGEITFSFSFLAFCCCWSSSSSPICRSFVCGDVPFCAH